MLSARVLDALVCSLLISAHGAIAFSSTSYATKTPRHGNAALFMSEKDVLFKSGRTDSAECIPDEEFCLIDEDTGKPIRLTIKEKERMFMDSLQSFYYSSRKVLEDEDFDKLKEDLQWSGSSMVVMNNKELKYLSAVQQYSKGTPMMTDVEFDTLKKELMEEGSKFAVQTEPQCYVDTGVCKVTLQEDKFRSNLLYLPAGSILMIAWLFFAFEFFGLFIRLNPIVLLLLGVVPVYQGAKALTENLIFQDKLVAYGPCPICEKEQRIYFGNILGVEGYSSEAEIKCPDCKKPFTVQRNSLRASSLPPQKK